jgi:outer membrane protein assembly factor BamB
MRPSFLAAVCGLLICSSAWADDWPQFRGPDRSNVSKEKGLLKAWPKGGPKLLWTFKDGGLGFSSVSVVKGVVYTLGTDAKFQDEYVIALDEKTGAELWRTKIAPIQVLQNNSWGNGPRGSPTIDGNLLYALGSQSELVCLDITAKGKLVWKKNLITDLGGKLMDAPGFDDGWGYSESPLVDGKLLICTPGGAKGTLAALDKTTGTVVWRGTDQKENAPYSSPVVAEFGGVRQYIQTGYGNNSGKEYGVISGYDAKSGKVLWSEKIFKGQSYAIGATPVVHGSQVYVTVGYGHGCHLFEIDKDQKATDQFSKAASKKVKNTHGGVVRIDDHIYGHSENKTWVCQDLKTGDLAWGERQELSCISGAITAADGLLYLYTDEGEVGLVEASPKGFNLLSSFPIPVRSQIPQTVPTSRAARPWAHPVIANGVLYVRENELLFAFAVK